ncbi:ATP-dependent RNA helicase DDX51 isoform X2 [Procambarus clarkii]|uniref:ATP-dependent RNA helicase DDX51 isoform X2 n=1 Tax=Procambarus clarkii TaxID=6728 RepID=UPI0037433212
MRVTQSAPITPGRYWGPSSNSGGGLGSPGGTSQASLILDRINARARALKAGKSPLDNRLLSEAKQRTSSDEPQRDDFVEARRKFVDEPASTKSIVDEEAHADLSAKGNITATSEVVSTCEDSFSEGRRKKKKKKLKEKETCEAEKEMNGDDRVGDVAVGRFKLVEAPVSTTTSKSDFTGKIEEVSSDVERKQKKKKKHKRKENSGELNQTLEEETSELVKEETIIYDLKGKKHKKKEKHRKEREENGEEIEHASCLDTLNNTEERMEEGLVKKKKKKKKKKADEEVGEDSQVDRLDAASCEPADESLVKSLKKEKKKEKKVYDNTSKKSNLDTVISVIEQAQETHEEINAEKSSKKKKRKRGMEESTDQFTEDSKAIEPEDGNVPVNFSTPESVKKKKRKKMKEVPEDFVNEVDSSVCGASRDGDEGPLRPGELPHDTLLDIHETPQAESSVDSKIINSELDASNVNETSTPGEDIVNKKKKNVKKKNSEKKRERKKEKRKEKRMKGKDKSGSTKDREIGGFTLMREVDATRKETLHRTLPQWLANPTVIGRDLQSDSISIDSIQGLDKSLKEILVEQKIERFFPVQKAVIPEILASASSLSIRYRPHDICVSAPTGSGKTLAYVLPIIQALNGRTVPRIRALVLLPVQELAIQVYKVFQTYVKVSNLKVGIAVGQKSFVKEQQSLVRQDYGGYHSCVDILVATPGKLADHLRLTKGIDLSSLRYLVFDEADHMLAADGGDWINRVEQYVKEHEAASENVLIGGFQGSGTTQFPHVPLHRLLFSATLSHDPERLQHVPLYRPKLFTASSTSSADKRMKVKEASVVGTTVDQYTRPAEMKEEYVVVEESVKPLLIYYMLTTKSWRKVLIFTNSIQATHKLTVLMAAMSEDLKIAEFSSIQKNKRHKIVSQFAAGKIDVLVSSDAMARGLDIPDIEYVVSYDVTSVSTYVHRIGRTARAGKPGTALSLVTKDTMSDFKAALSNNLNGATQLNISMEELKPYESLYVNALAKMKEILQEEEQEKRQHLVASVFRPRGNKKKGFSGGWPANTGVKKFVKRLQNYRKPYRVR